MNKTLKVLGIIVLSLLSLLAFHILHFYYPSNILSKIVRATAVVLTPVVIALIILYLIGPLTKMFVDKFKWKKRVAITATMILFFIVVIGLGGFIVIFVYKQGILLYEQLSDPGFLTSVEAWFLEHNMIKIYNALYNYIVNFDFTLFLGPINSLLSFIFQVVTTIILVPIFLWHFLNVDDNITANIQSNLPSSWHETVIPLIQESNDVVSAYFRSKIISIVILFVMFIFTYVVLGLPIGYAILFAFLIAILDIIPYVGPTLGLIIPVIYIFSTNGSNILYINSLHLDAWIVIVILFGLNVLIQFIQGNIVVPAISGKEMNIHPALILVFMLFLGYILGIWGVILAIPIGGIIIVIWNYIKTLDFFNKKYK